MKATVFHYHKSNKLKNNVITVPTCQRQGISQSDKLLLERAREDQNGDDACSSFVPCVNELYRREN